jgi:hypothetical protein
MPLLQVVNRSESQAIRRVVSTEGESDSWAGKLERDGWLAMSMVMSEYNNPSFATMFERALLNTYITTCFGLYILLFVI